MAFELTPLKLVYGGEALGYAEGAPVLVPRALPGEIVQVETVRRTKGIIHARPISVLQPAPERIGPPCPYFGRCGGCHYQHLAFEQQPLWKAEILRETLRRIGKIAWEKPIPTLQSDALGYRNHAQFKVGGTDAGGISLGFFEAESHRLVPVSKCLLLSPLLNSILAELQKPEWLNRLAGCSEIDLLADDRDRRARAVFKGNFLEKEARKLSDDLLKNFEALSGLVFAGNQNSLNFGDPIIRYCVDEFEYQISPGSFFQSSRLLLPAFAKRVTDSAEGELVLDLYAGVGLLTLPLARRFKNVVAVESNRAAADDINANTRNHELAGHIRVVNATASDFLRRFSQGEPDLIVLDPPRAGIDPSTVKRIFELRARRIHYASCHPPTWARDLARLTALGYRLETVEMFDLFPQTYHLECLACLNRQA